MSDILVSTDNDLTETELRVLAIMRGVRYGHREAQFRRLGLSSGEVEAIRAGLIRRDYLTRGGAITAKGKQVAEHVHNWN